MIPPFAQADAVAVPPAGAAAAAGLRRAPRPPLVPLSAPFLIVDDFLTPELAEAMRAGIDAHFAAPGDHRPETHQVWNYWFVPDLYTYLRTSPEKVIGRPAMEAFVGALTAWAAVVLGMGEVTWPYLSLYVSGCGQGLHNDAANGRFTFVYSLTRDDRRSTGGETLIMREGDPLRGRLAEPAAGRAFYDVIEPRFNRLVVFDDRMPHAVQRVEGPMDPAEGRFVLHGHLREAGILVEGALGADQVRPLVLDALGALADRAAARLSLYDGLLVLRLAVAASGAVAGCSVIVDRVLHPDPADAGWKPLRARIVECLSALRFPAAPAGTTLTQPILFKGGLSGPL